MATIGNNDSQEIAHVRDCFFDSMEERRFNRAINFSLKGYPMKNEIDFYCDNNASQYYKLALSIINDVENGNVSDEHMLGAETLINYCLGKIDDFHLEQTQEITKDAFISQDDELSQ